MNADLYDQYVTDLKLKSYAIRTIQSYLRGLRQLQNFCCKALEDISEEEVREYWLLSTCAVSSSTSCPRASSSSGTSASSSIPPTPRLLSPRLSPPGPLNHSPFTRGFMNQGLEPNLRIGF